MDIASIAILLLATIGPTRAAIVFVGMTQSADAKQLKRKIALKTVLVSAIVCCIFVVLGSVILGD